jgi:CxxC motif-containing protein
MTIQKNKISNEELEQALKSYFSTIFYFFNYENYEPNIKELFSKNDDDFDKEIDAFSLDTLIDMYLKINSSLPAEICHLINDSGEKITMPIFESIQQCSVQYDLYLAKTFWGQTQILESSGVLLTNYLDPNDLEFNRNNYDGEDLVNTSIQVGENEYGFLIKEDKSSFHSKYGIEELTYDIIQYNHTTAAIKNDNNVSSFQETRRLKDMPDFTLNSTTFPNFLSSQIEIELINKIRENPISFKDQVIAILTKENEDYEHFFVREGYYEINNWYVEIEQRITGGRSEYILNNLSIYPYLPFSLKIDLDVLLALFIRCMHTKDLANKGILPPANLQELKQRIDLVDSQIYESRNYFPIELKASFFGDVQFEYNISEIAPFIQNNLNRVRELFFLFPDIIFFAPDSIKQNDEIALEAVNQNGIALQYLSEKFKNNKHFVLTAVKQNGLALEFVSDSLKNNREVVISAVVQSANAFRFVPDKFKNDRKIARVVVNQNPNLLANLSNELKNDKMLVLTAVKQDGLALMFASNELKNDRQVVLTAIKQNGSALEFASASLKADKALVAFAIKQNGRALVYATDLFKADRKLVLSALKKNGLVLEFVSEDLKNDRQVVLTAIKQSGCALEYASTELKHDKSLALAAIKNNWYAFEFVPNELRNNRDIIKTYSKTGRLGSYISNSLRNNSYAVLLFVKKYAGNLEYASEELKGNKKIVMEAVKQAGYTLSYASETLKNNPQVVLKAVMQNGMALQYASEKLRDNKKIVLAAIQNDYESFEFASENLKQDFDLITYFLQ